MKIQPAEWLRKNNKRVDDIDFARKPFGTGPYRLPADFTPSTPAPGEAPRDLALISNPAYGKRAGKIGRPLIKEIHFTDLNLVSDPVLDVRADRIHMIPDVSTSDLPKFLAENNGKGKIRIITPTVNRRIQILAVNYGRTALRSVDLRGAITHAIDREKVLTDVFRAGKPEYHKALSGPFPVNTWAVPRQPQPLFNLERAQAMFRNYSKQEKRATEIELLYPSDDPKATQACGRIKSMIEAAAAAEEFKFTVRLDMKPPREFLELIATHRYDLAYMPFDYRNDWYPLTLGAFLDPDACTGGGRNICEYLEPNSSHERQDDDLARLFTEARTYRDPAKIEELAFKIHRAFNDASPFIPLWQLDRHMVMSTSVKPYLEGSADEANPHMLDATNPFTSIAEWRLE